MITRANSRKYFVLALKRAGVSQQDLVKAYCAFIRPVMEYAVHVWHPGLTKVQHEQIERIQKQVLRIVLPESSYREALLATGLQTLGERRVNLCMKFAAHLMKDPEVRTWLPRTRAQAHGLNLRNNSHLSSLPYKSQRFSRSPMAVSYTHLTLPTNREV